MSLLPVTVLSGFLGAGKTTVLDHLLRGSHGRRIAVIVNDMSEVNIDAELVRRGDRSLARTTERLIELSNGCICCTLREDLLIEVGRLAAAGRFDAVIIESSGISEPMPVAATFEVRADDGSSLADVTRLDAMVTIVDAERFLAELDSFDDLAGRGLALGPDDDRSLGDLLVEQVEFADVLVINKCDRVTADELARLQLLLRHLNPGARQLPAVHGQVDPDALLGTDLYRVERARGMPGWARELAGDHQPETEAYGIRSFVYRARRPFHPERLAACLGTDWPGVLRSKGFFWLATRMDEVGSWSHAGRSCQVSAAGTWWAACSPDERAQHTSAIADQWVEPWGDRRQELVFIGIDMDEARLRAALDACLLDDDEMAAGVSGWRRLADPFGSWAAYDEDADDQTPHA
jgi:G3E family GTPase